MNYPAASSGVSKRNMFTPDAASGGELNPKRLIRIQWYKRSKDKSLESSNTGL